MGPEAVVLCHGSRRPLGQCLEQSKSKFVADRYLEGQGYRELQRALEKKIRLPECRWG